RRPPDPRPHATMDRRTFLNVAAVGAGALAAQRLGGVVPGWPAASALRGAERLPLSFPPTVSPSGLTLTAGTGRVTVAGASEPAWTFGGGVPGPTVRARRGDRAGIALENALPEPTIVHWHGLHVPQEADGHPR